MNTWLIISIIAALGLIVGNIMLLKYSAKMKFEKPRSETEKTVTANTTDSSNAPESVDTTQTQQHDDKTP